MPADIQILLNLDEQILAARRVYSLTQRQRLDLPSLVAGNTLQCALYLIDGTGAYRAESGASGYEPRLIITDPADPATVLVQLEPAAFTQIADGWSFNLPLTTEEISDYLGTEVAKVALVEINLTTPADLLKTLYRTATAILAEAFDPEGTVPENPSSYLTNLQTWRGHVRHLPAVTQLTGGTAAALDGQATLAGAVAAGDKFLVYLPATKDLLLYEAVAGDAGTESAYAVKADDQPSALYYALRQHLGRDGRPVVYNSTQAKFHQLAATGGAGLEVIGLGAAFTIPTT